MNIIRQYLFSQFSSWNFKMCFKVGRSENEVTSEPNQITFNHICCDVLLDSSCPDVNFSQCDTTALISNIDPKTPSLSNYTDLKILTFFFSINWFYSDLIFIEESRQKLLKLSSCQT